MQPDLNLQLQLYLPLSSAQHLRGARVLQRPPNSQIHP